MLRKIGVRVKKAHGASRVKVLSHMVIKKGHLAGGHQGIVLSENLQEPCWLTVYKGHRASVKGNQVTANIHWDGGGCLMPKPELGCHMTVI